MRGNIFNGEVRVRGNEFDGEVRERFDYLPLATFVRERFHTLNVNVGKVINYFYVEIGERFHDFNSTIKWDIFAFAILYFSTTECCYR